jgi:GTPase SAR1 family protein
MNILLLGETGVGKSTFINAFANYLTFETLEEAMNGKILALIASSFAVTDEHFKHHKVRIGEDINENNSSGQSATQACKSYLFPFENLAIRLIDTPGIGDTRGIEQDKINLDNILGFIGQHEDLHGICILMKPNNARLTVSFSFCIKELLCHLQKDAARNIMFAFTNSRSTFYKPGDTAPTLKAILEEIEKSPPYVRIPFEKETVYCYDNESFRFLMAHNEGIRFQVNQSRIFSDSWKISVKVIQLRNDSFNLFLMY